MRTDHLAAVIKYALEQAKTSNGEINALSWDDNENAIGEAIIDMRTVSPQEYEAHLESVSSDLIATLEDMLKEVEQAKQDHHKEILLVNAQPTDLLPKLLNLWQALYRDPMAPNAWGDATYELIYDDYMSADMQPNEEAAKRVADTAEALANEFSHELIVRLEVQERLRQAYSIKE